MSPDNLASWIMGLLLVGLLSPTASVPLAASDMNVLLDLNTTWPGALNWTSGSDCDGLNGVTCNDTGYVTKLDFARNRLTGSIPESIFKLSALTELHLEYNQLTEFIPESIGSLSALTYLDFGANRLTGSIPETIGILSALTDLHLNHNQFTGSTPENVSQLSALLHLDLSFNNLTGVIPKTIGKLKSLGSLYLGDNQLTGSIPESIGNLSALTNLYLNINNLTGSIPKSIVQLLALTHLYLGHNQLSGSIPESMGSLQALSKLLVNDNQLTGSIPESIGNIPALIHMYLSNNSLIGSIPESIGNLASLTLLDLSHNNLTGPIPSSIGKLRFAKYLDLSYNYFTKLDLPVSSFGSELNVSQVQNFTRKNCIRNATISKSNTECHSFCLADDYWTPCGGPDAGFCSFTGPKAQCTCKEGFTLANSSCTPLPFPPPSRPPSPPPLSLHPPSLPPPSALPPVLPPLAPLPLFPPPLSLHPPALPPPIPPPSDPPPLSLRPPALPPTSAPPPILPPLAPPPPTHKGKSSLLLIVGGVAGALLTCTAIGVVAFCCCFAIASRRRRGYHFHKKMEALSLQNYTRRQILAATANFSNAAIIGKGGSGTVYLAKAPDGTPWAVKRANLATQKTLAVFENEVHLISYVRHPNLVALLGYHCQGDEQVLVYEYVPNGTLYDRVFPRHQVSPASVQQKALPLSFEQRLEVLVGVARGVNYLHTFAADPIVHRDIKSSNVLLDDNLQAKVADFGFSKSMQKCEGNEQGTFLLSSPVRHTSVVGTPGYMDPEYYSSVTVTVKSDVYSFGVVMLELLTGKPAVMYDPETAETMGLARWALPFLAAGKFESILDPQLGADLPLEKYRVVACVARMCIAPLGRDRPSMAQVTRYLEAAQGSTLLFDTAGLADSSLTWDSMDMTVNEILAEASSSSSTFTRAPLSQAISGR